MLSAKKHIVKSLLISAAVVSTLTAVGHTKTHASNINGNNVRITRQASIKRNQPVTASNTRRLTVQPVYHHIRTSRMNTMNKPLVQKPNVRPIYRIHKVHNHKAPVRNNYIRLGSSRHHAHYPMGRPVPSYIHYLKARRRAARRYMRHGYRRMARIANTKLGDPYVWGGNGPTQFDCSGFTQYLYRHGMHKYIPRTAGAQYFYGRPVTEQQAHKGDLVFFGSGINNIEHVGMFIGNDQMVDAQLRGVVVEKIHAPWWNLVGFSHIL